MKFLRRMAEALRLSEEISPPRPSAAAGQSNAPRAQFDFVAVDVETASAARHSICQIGVVAYREGREVLAISELVDPETEFDAVCVAVHGITARHVRGRRPFQHHYGWLSQHLAGTHVVSHSAFDRQAISAACDRYGASPPDCRWIDTVVAARRAWPDLPNHRLPTVAEHLGYRFGHHDALEDARAAAHIAMAASKALSVGVGDLGGLLRQRSAARFASQAKASEATGSGPLSGHCVTITGELWADRKAIASTIGELGAGFSPTVTKRTTIVLLGEGGVGTAKHQAALAARASGRDLEIVEAGVFRKRFGL